MVGGRKLRSIMIAGSQSRYIQQQEVVFDVNALASDTVNRGGTVDENDKVVLIKNVSHKNRGVAVGSVVASAFNFLLDFFGVGKHALQGTNSNLQGTIPFLPDWSAPFWIAVKYQPSASDTNGVIFHMENTAGGSTHDGVRMKMSEGNSMFIYWRTAGSTIEKRVTLAIDASPKLIHVQFFGTNDANDWKVYYNEVEQAKTVSLNEDYTGQVLFAGNRLNWGDFGSQPALGHFGGMAFGYGIADVEKIQKKLG